MVGSLSQSLRLVAGRRGSPRGLFSFPSGGVWKQGQRLSLHVVLISCYSSGSLALNPPPLHRKPLQARAEAGFKEAAWGRQRPAHLISIRPLSTSGLLPASRAPSQNPPGIQNPRIVLLSDSISSGKGRVSGGACRELGTQQASLDPVSAFPALAPYPPSHTLCREGCRLWIYKLKTQHFAAIFREQT